MRRSKSICHMNHIVKTQKKKNRFENYILCDDIGVFARVFLVHPSCHVKHSNTVHRVTTKWRMPWFHCSNRFCFSQLNAVHVT